jgi:formylglycine-generating enzyme required for sulfatase activity
MKQMHFIKAFFAVILIGIILGCNKTTPIETEKSNVLYPPILSSPLNNAINVEPNPCLVWNSSQGAESYTLQISLDSMFSDTIYNQGVTSSSQVVALDLAKTYYWRVNAVNSTGTSAWSGWWKFSTAFGGSTVIEWVKIPAGYFTMGSTSSDPYYYYNELPLHDVFLDSFEISKFEITNAQYSAFMSAGGYSDSIYWTNEGWAWRKSNNVTEPAYWSAGTFNNGPNFPGYPVNGVSWYEAYAFCKWAGGHLPSEAQWEKAARGTVVTNYWPWDSLWDASKCNSNVNSSPDNYTYSSPVGTFSNGQSMYGVYDMVGNILEWVNDWYQSDYYSISPVSNPTGPLTGTYRILRGGSFYHNGYFCRCTNRYSDVTPDAPRSGFYGFRIAK